MEKPSLAAINWEATAFAYKPVDVVRNQIKPKRILLKLEFPSCAISPDFAAYDR